MKTYLLPVSILALAGALIASVLLWNAQSATGSVIMGGEYDVTELSTGLTTISTLPATIGSIVVNNSSAAASVSFYATTTAATSSADLLMSFDLAAGEGTYVYDVAVAPGIVMDVDAAYDGNIEVTHRR